MRNYWKIYAREDSRSDYNPEDFAAVCFRQKLIAVGWNKVGNLSNFQNHKQLKDAVKEKDITNKSCVSSLWAFKNSIKPSDVILTPSKKSKIVYVGYVTPESDYYFDRTILERKCRFAHRRIIKWSKRILNEKDIVSIWGKSKNYGGQQTVSQIHKKLPVLKALLKIKNPKRLKNSSHKPQLPDKEWGREAELRAMIWLKSNGMKPKDVSKLYRGWDIECGLKLFEVKGRKSNNTVIRLTQNEWNSAMKHKNNYTLLIFTASSKKLLSKSLPQQIPNPAQTEEWVKKIRYEYFLNE